MNSRARALFAVTLLGALLLSWAPGATAAPSAETAPRAETAGALPAPTLESATIKLNRIILIWDRVADERVTGYVISANGKLLPHGWRTDASQDFTQIDFGPGDGLTGREVFTVAAASDFGSDGIPRNVSLQSNGLVPVAPGTLPAPELTSATVKRDSVGQATVTMTWTPSRSDDEVIHYLILVPGPHGGTFVSSVDNATTLTFIADACGGACPLSGNEEYSVKAIDRTMAESPPSNSLVPTPEG
jgi:hypothetical protein